MDRTVLEWGRVVDFLASVSLSMSVKTISNFPNHLFHTPLGDMFAGRKWHSATQQAA